MQFIWLRFIKSNHYQEKITFKLYVSSLVLKLRLLDGVCGCLSLCCFSISSCSFSISNGFLFLLIKLSFDDFFSKYTALPLFSKWFRNDMLTWNKWRAVYLFQNITSSLNFVIIVCLYFWQAKLMGMIYNLHKKVFIHSCYYV